MAATNYTPISLYYSTTASAAPTAGNLTNGELAINITDGVLFYKDNAGAVQTLATKAATSGTYTSITLSGGTINGVAYLNSSKILTTGSALTFDGATFGIGTGSLRIDATSNIYGKSDNTSFVSLYGGGAYNSGAGIGLGGSSNSGSPNTIVFTRGAYVETARFDSAGNLGLGVTPSAWVTTTTSRGLQFGRSGALFYSTDNAATQLMGNIYQSAANTYTKIQTGYAGMYTINDYNGQHQWYNFATGSGTATPSQVMTLDASGNLGVGITPTNRLHAAGTNAVVKVEGTSTSSSDYINFYNTADKAYVGIENSSGTGIIGSNSAYALIVSTASTNPLVFGTGGTERARIDSSGNLLVGTTSALAKFAVSNGSASTNGIRADNGSASITGKNIWSTYTSSGNNNTTAIHYAAYDGTVGGDVFRVYGNGNVVNNNNSYGAISDVKLKENIVDTTPKLEKLCQVRVVNYNLKTDPEHKQLGVIAQELEQIFPSMVEESPDSDIDGNDLGTTTKQVKYSVFVPMLIKAIQELKAEFDAYKAEHP